MSYIANTEARSAYDPDSIMMSHIATSDRTHATTLTVGGSSEDSLHTSL